ncbi:MAG: LD-carboxypeptidase [Deltaproteobacteria bacterium]|nr:LD-carboxypeptidase [Deltaproteobacteria bacterium]MBW2386016.1 LD-carboxypeptidase [Deltaproteobacteria bacterium]MBW2695230.1 LD-carboxypeptidase [Deltaproteobacteria bacterium]
MPTLKKARAIRPGATVGIAAPAGVVDPDRLEAGEQMLRRLGFEPMRRADLVERKGYLAGDDERRAAELMELVRDPDVEAIVCARGGYGSSRIIDRLDAAEFRAARKPLVGYSDITTLLLWQRRAAGLMGIHGPMLEHSAPLCAEVTTSLVRALTGTGPPQRLAGRTLTGGWAEGRLTGGSLSLAVASLGTPWEIDTRGAILMLEDIGEPPYRLDRLLQQLHWAGKLTDVAGVGIGSMCRCDDDRYPDLDVEAVLQGALEPLGVPVVTGLPFGHDAANLCWPHGGRAAIDGDRGEIELLESAVAAR